MWGGREKDKRKRTEQNRKTIVESVLKSQVSIIHILFFIFLSHQKRSINMSKLWHLISFFTIKETTLLVNNINSGNHIAKA